MSGHKKHMLISILGQENWTKQNDKNNQTKGQHDNFQCVEP